MHNSAPKFLWVRNQHGCQTSAQAEQLAIYRRLHSSEVIADSGSLPLAQAADLLESRALTSQGEKRRSLFSEAFSCWKLGAEPGDGSAPLLDEGYLPERLSLAFHAAATGVLAERPSEAQHLLLRLLGPVDDPRYPQTLDDSWRSTLLYDVTLAACLLVRQKGGWKDIKQALELMDGLRAKQAELEEAYLDELPEMSGHRLLELVCCYHLAQVVTTTGQYLCTGSGGPNKVTAEIERHRDHALEAATAINDAALARLARLLCALSASMIGSVSMESALPSR